VPETADALARLAPSLEAEVKTRLGGFLGGVVRSYLPQTWVFRTGQDAASLTVDGTGHVSVVPTAAPAPDVAIELPAGTLPTLLAGRGKGGAVPPGVKVTPLTPKGKTAFDFLRGRLGL
jgi:hypothetical protein